jgi:hypothetical protein
MELFVGGGERSFGLCNECSDKLITLECSGWGRPLRDYVYRVMDHARKASNIYSCLFYIHPHGTITLTATPLYIHLALGM